MASLLQTIKDLDIHAYKYIQIHACVHANRHTHILTLRHTSTKIGQSTVLQNIVI